MVEYALVGITLFLCCEVYVLAKRWGMAVTTAILIAGKLADPLRAKWVEKTVAQRDRYDSNGQERESEQANRDLAELDPMCALGRAELWETAWEIYKDSGRIKTGDYFKLP